MSLSGLDRLPLELIDLVLSELDCVDLMYFGFSLPPVAAGASPC
jgi:hypothetical protein